MSNTDTTDDAMQGESRLLKLAAELRNTIYTYALVQEDHIEFDKKHHKQPPLLCVNRQIRSEASPIYYQLNAFNIDGSDFNPTAIQLFSLQSRRWLNTQTQETVKPNIYIDFTSRTANWGNVMAWAKAAHADPWISSWTAEESDAADLQVASRVADLAGRLSLLNWKAAKEILEEMKTISEQEKVEWVEE